jgi:hypothetical protein
MGIGRHLLECPTSLECIESNTVVYAIVRIFIAIDF